VRRVIGTVDEPSAELDGAGAVAPVRVLTEDPRLAAGS
jgi:hypothetical protein